MDHHNYPISREDFEKFNCPAVLLLYIRKSSDKLFGLIYVIRCGRETFDFSQRIRFPYRLIPKGKSLLIKRLLIIHCGKDDPISLLSILQMKIICERPQSLFCPVKVVELYPSKLKPELSSLWQRPKAGEKLIKCGIVMNFSEYLNTISYSHTRYL